MKRIFRWVGKWALGQFLGRIDDLTDAQVVELAERIDRRIDIPWLKDNQEAIAIRGAIRACVAFLREFADRLREVEG